MRGLRLACLLAFMSFSCCSLIPHEAKILSRDDLGAHHPPAQTGVIAFAPLGEPVRERLVLDLRHLESDRLYRITLNPSLEPTLAWNSSDSSSDSGRPEVGPGIAFYELPTGTYLPRYIGSIYSPSVGHPSVSKFSIKADTLSIQAGVISSLGFLEYRWEFRGLLENPLLLEVLGPNIDTLIRSAGDSKLSRWKIHRATLRIHP